ncbi:MAG: HAMP domain-containing histidine kinase [Bacteroidetes bacterium]|nr:HAMP domain-containing histidine kinase [Bacteroidota bacterium]
MKLLTKTTLYIATLSLFLFFIMGIIFFHVLRNLSLADLNRELSSLTEVVDSYLAKEPDQIPIHMAGIDTLSVEKLSHGQTHSELYGDTLMFDTESSQYRTYRYISYQSDQGQNSFLVKVYKSTTPTDQLVERVTLMMTFMVLIFLAGVFLLNRTVFANLWKDFFEALEKLKEFDTAKEPVVLGDQDIEEFSELKDVLEKMTQQLSRDYRELKEYTDHITHELQTPLAIIKSKADLLIQSDKLGPDEMRLIQAINASTTQLSRLNSTLTLITRIENRQFTEKVEIDLSLLLDRHLGMMEELIDLHRIRLNRFFTEGSVTILMDEGLADMLVANLLKNAIIHNEDGGAINIETGPDSFSISNDGPPLPFAEEDIFRRFVKEPGKGSGFGLGLSLVKKICESYGFSLGYSHDRGQHKFVLIFSG